MAETTQSDERELAWHVDDPADVLAAVGADPEGLSTPEALAWRERHGGNEVPSAAAPSVPALLLRQVRSPLMYALVVAAAVAVALGEIEDGIVVLAVVVLNTLIGFVQADARDGRVPEQKPRTIATAASSTEATPIAAVMARPTRSSSRVSGVCSGLTDPSSSAMRPTCVRGPVATVTPTPHPAATSVPAWSRLRPAFGGFRRCAEQRPGRRSSSSAWGATRPTRRTRARPARRITSPWTTRQTCYLTRSGRSCPSVSGAGPFTASSSPAGTLRR